LDSKFTHSKVFDQNNQLESRRAQGDDVKVRLISNRKLELVGASKPMVNLKFHLDQTRGVSHCGLAISIKKYLKAKEELWKLKYYLFHHAKIYPIFKKKSSKRNQKISRYYNSITNLKFQHKPKYHLSKILI